MGLLRIAHDPASTSSEAVLDVAESAIRVFEEHGDRRGLGRAWLAVATVRGGYDSRSVEAAGAAAKAAECYRRAGWSPSTCLSLLAAALFYGPVAVEEAIARARRLIEKDPSDRLSHANVLVWMGGLEAMRGNFDEGRDHVENARRTYHEFGQTVSAEDTCGLVTGVIEMLAGRYVAAEEALERSCETCKRLHESAFLASRAAELARALYAQARFSEADEWADVAERNAAPIDLPAQFTWRAVRAKLRAQRGDFGGAERLISEALRLVERTDALSEHGDVLLGFAEVLRLAGRPDEAEARTAQAIDLYKSKGNVVAAKRAQAPLLKTAPV
jgi:tetratricopeptide (TPR) repeat protein